MMQNAADVVVFGTKQKEKGAWKVTLNFIEEHIKDLSKLDPLLVQGVSCMIFACTSEYMLEVEGGSEESKGRLKVD